MNDHDKLTQYRQMILAAVTEFDFAQLAPAVQLIRETWQADRQIFTIGNGGSAAVAVHLAADFGKNIAKTGEKFPRIMSLCVNSSALTALGNDCGYEETFSGQLCNFMNPGDLVVAISSSGNSPNIIRGVEFAKERGGKVIGMSGFDGGKLKQLADISLHVPVDVYEVVEDAHSIFCHAIIHAMKSA